MHVKLPWQENNLNHTVGLVLYHLIGMLGCGLMLKMAEFLWGDDYPGA
jgi:hypothetical protein